MKSLYLLLILSISLPLAGQYSISEAISVTDLDNSFGRKNPKVAINAEGEPMVFWMRTGSNEAFFISTLSDDTFSTPVQIPFGGLNPNLWSGSLGPNMASYGDDVYVTFEVYGDAIYVVHSSDGGATWGDPIAAFTPPTGRKATIPIIAVDNDAQPYIAYVNTDASEGDAYYGMVRSTDFGESFLEEVNVSLESAGDEVCECCNGHIDIDDNGDIYVAFRNNDANQRDIWLAISTDGGSTFSSAYDVDETDWIINACPTNGPHFAFAGNEVVSAFYSGGGVDGSRVYYSSFDTETNTSNSTFTLPLTDESSINQNRPKVAGYGDTLAIVWQEKYSGSLEIGMTISTSGFSGLGIDPFLLTNMPANQTYPSVLYSDASFHIVYEDNESGTVLYQRVSIGTVGLDELNESSVDFGPNPASDKLEIRFNDQNRGSFSVKIYNLSGQELMNITSLVDDQHIDVSELTPGLYLLHVQFENGENVLKKFIKD